MSPDNKDPVDLEASRGTIKVLVLGSAGSLKENVEELEEILRLTEEFL